MPRGEIIFNWESIFMFWGRTMAMPNGCVFWNGQLAEGYGVYVFNKVEELAHRFAYRAERGPIPEGLLACHTCDTPHCVNPYHIFLGTDWDNNRDMVRKGRAYHPLGSKSPNAKLNEKDVKEIRAVYTGKYGEIKQLAERFQVTTENISIILQRKSWTHV